MKKKKDNELLRTIVASGIAGVIVIALMGFLMLRVIKDDEGAKKPDDVEKVVVTNPEATKGDKDKIIGVVTDVDLTKREVRITPARDEKQTLGIQSMSITIPNTIQIKDKYGTQMTLKELNSGDIVAVKYTLEDKVAVEFRLSSEAWEHTVKGIIINEAAKTLSRGNDTYTYDDSLMKLSSGRDFDIGSLTKLDQVKISGYKDQLLSIELISSHGFIKFEDYDTFIGATVDIDLDKNMILDKDNEELMVEEGKHRVVIKQDGYEPFVKEVVVLPGVQATISLAEFQPKRGEVEFVIEPKEAKIYIDEKLQTDLSNPVLLDYGTYSLRIIMDDLVVAEEELVVDKTYIRYNKTIAPPDTRRSIKVITDPIGVELFVNNVFMGYTPLSIMLEPGDHNAMLLKQGYNMVEYPIHVTEGKDEQTFTFPPLRKKSEGGNEENTNDNLTEPAPPSGNDETTTPREGEDGQNGGVKTPGDDVYDQEG